jgi:hypothetical protein
VCWWHMLRAIQKLRLVLPLLISVRWGDLGSPVRPGTYRGGPHMVEVTPGDIKLADGNPDAIFTAIHPDFYAAEAPYLLTGVELPTKP